MPPAITPLVDWVRRQRILRAAAHGAVRLIPDIPRTVQVEALGPLRIRLRRHRWFLWEQFGLHDGPIFAAFERLIRPGDVVWDVGANIGTYTRVIRQWFEAGTVIAVEPMAENFALLEENIRLGNLADVRALRMALSDRTGEESLQIDDVTSGTAVLDSVSGGAASEGRQAAGLPPRVEKVRVARLDDLVEQDGLPLPKVIKIDTEGAEVQVLAGAERTLRAHSLRLAIALHGPDKAAGTIELLARFGYVCFAEVVAGQSRTWQQLTLADAARLRNNNVVACPESERALLETPLRTSGPWPRVGASEQA